MKILKFNKQDKIFFIFDAYYFIFRSYYTFFKKSFFHINNFNASIIMGFTNSLFKILIHQKPSHVAVVFDQGNKKTFRHVVYKNYKSNRKKTPNLIRLSIPYIKKLLNILNIKYVYCNNYEADDVIATLAKKAEKLNYDVYVVTSDKDLSQIVTKKIKIYQPATNKNKFQILGIKDICNKYNIHKPLDFIDVFTMVGDVTDNIPGVPGIGIKNAIKILKRYKNLDFILNNTNHEECVFVKKIKQYEKTILISKKLLTIVYDAPIDFNEKDFFLNKINYKKSCNFFTTLGFTSIINRLKLIFNFYN